MMIFSPRLHYLHTVFVLGYTLYVVRIFKYNHDIFCGRLHKINGTMKTAAQDHAHAQWRQQRHKSSKSSTWDQTY